jgi:DNA-binding transcriptional regulator PaaX
MFAAVAHCFAVVTASVSSTISDWFETNGSALITATLILVAAFVLNLIVHRSIRLAVDRLVKASESRRERVEGEDDASGLPEDAVRRRHEEEVRRERSEQRARTVGSLLLYVATIVISAVAVFMATSSTSARPAASSSASPCA